jgi:hypothetical protein
MLYNTRGFGHILEFAMARPRKNSCSLESKLYITLNISEVSLGQLSFVPSFIGELWSLRADRKILHQEVLVLLTEM